MDQRVRARLEREAGLPLEAVPAAGVSVRQSPARSDAPGKRLFALQVAGREGVLITAIPRLLEPATRCAESMTPWEIFSPLGLAEMRRALSPGDAEKLWESYGLDYVLTDLKDFRPAETPHRPVALRRKDIPPAQLKLRLSERRQPVAEDFVWAFACYHDDADAPATELAPFGPRCASIAIVIWQQGLDVATYGVGTEEGYRRRGYGLAAVSAATEWILQQGAVAWYQAYADNIPSLRIARRLGFQFVCRMFGA